MKNTITNKVGLQLLAALESRSDSMTDKLLARHAQE